MFVWNEFLTRKTCEKRPRESILRQEFDKAIKIINNGLPGGNHFRFLHCNLHKNSQRSKPSLRSPPLVELHLWRVPRHLGRRRRHAPHLVLHQEQQQHMVNLVHQPLRAIRYI